LNIVSQAWVTGSNCSNASRNRTFLNRATYKFIREHVGAEIVRSVKVMGLENVAAQCEPVLGRFYECRKSDGTVEREVNEEGAGPILFPVQ